jgi:putative flippase GtrA
VANTLWTFERRPQPRSFARFVFVSLGGLVLTRTLAGTAEVLGFPFYVGLGAVVAVVPVASFALHRLWTYSFV